jgi:hypothetical protein
MPLDVADSVESLAPTGFIFHVSRCGSTLIAQMLAALERSVVISQAAPVDDVMQAGLSLPDLPRHVQIRWLRQVVAALGQRRTGAESLYFLKFDAWHIHHLPLIREAFPGVPWVFVHRDASAVVASQLRRPGLLGSPGAIDRRVLGLRLEDITALTREQWCTRVIGDLFAAADAFRGDPSGLFIDHAQLPGAVWGPIASHFGVQLSEAELARMQQAAKAGGKASLREPALNTF